PAASHWRRGRKTGLNGGAAVATGSGTNRASGKHSRPKVCRCGGGLQSGTDFPVLSSPKAGFMLPTLFSTARRSGAAFFASRNEQGNCFGHFRGRKRTILRGLLFLARNRARTEHRSSRAGKFMPLVRKLMTFIASKRPPENWSGKRTWRTITRLRIPQPSAP